MNNISHDNDNVSRLFREHNNIGPDSSLWLRPLRQLFKDGKPTGQLVVLTVSPTEQQRLPFGMLTKTKKDRIIFWPTLPSGVNMVCAGVKVDVFDHITLVFPSEKIHVTAYKTSGQAIHVGRAWRTHHFSSCNISLWFMLLVRVSILRQQDMAVQRRVKMPTTDKKRRVDEFIRYRNNLSFSNISLPHSDPQCDYIYCGFYLAPDSITEDQLSTSIFPADSSLASEIEGWPDGNMFQIAWSQLRIGQRIICIATACPPGKLRSDVSLGFPRSGGSRPKKQ